jgi:hypothetical protein
MLRKAICRTILGLAFTSLALHANIVVVGNPPMLGTGNCDPFGCPGFFGLSTYQQVYLSSAFPSEISIAGLTFYDGQVFNGGQPAGGTYSLSLSYTSLAPGDLNLSNPANNVGSGSQGFFSGTLPPLTPQTGGSFLVIDGTPFVYNPADGNLLLTVTVSGGTNTGPALFLNEAACGPDTHCPPNSTVVSSDAYFGTTNGGNDAGGLVTGFDYTPITTDTPEPSSLLLVMTGIGLLFYSRRRRAA